MSSIRDRFLDDYFSECDDHLNTIRHGLLALEASVGKPRPDKAVTEELFRSYHSLKGLAGMVEDREGELLAHEMEGYLRAVRDGDVPLTIHGVEVLIEGTRWLEHTIAARRDGQPPPDSTAALSNLRTLVSSAAPRAASGDVVAADREAAAWECIFTPSPALIARGINVDVARTRLRQVGEIVSAAPLINDDGGVAFRFLFTGTPAAQSVDEWRADGMVCTPLSDPEAGDAEAPPVATVPDGVLSSGHHVRVDLSRLDDLMRMIGDLVILRARLGETLARIEPHAPPLLWRAVQENVIGIERQLRELREGVMRVRLVPVGEIFRRMPFVVRDLARESGRRVEVTLAGQDTEIDKFLVERMMDPVLHLVRNAVSHGIESAEERIAAGKPPSGHLSLSASASGELVTIDIADDGRGVDVERVLERARLSGLPVPAGPVDAAVVLDLICSPGFSTRDETDRASGRGYGMAVVRTTVQDLGGALRLTSTPGQGTRFAIDLPLTLAITDALLARVGAQTFAVPQASVREVVEIETGTIRVLEGGEVFPYRGAALPLVRLSSVLGIATSEQAHKHAFIVGTGSTSIGLLADRIIGQREIVVRSTVDPLIRVDGISGATDLGDGHAVLILDVGAVAALARKRGLRPGPRAVQEIA